LPPLAVVNRQAYNEAAPVFYRENTLEFNSETLGSTKPNYRHWLPYDQEQVLPPTIVHKYKSMIANLTKVDFTFSKLFIKITATANIPDVGVQEPSCGKVKATCGTDGKVETIVEPTAMSRNWNYVSTVLLKQCNTADFSGRMFASNRLVALVYKVECAIEMHELCKCEEN
jgi:hypothetical protein